jgi:hypothetical protein
VNGVAREKEVVMRIRLVMAASVTAFAAAGWSVAQDAEGLAEVWYLGDDGAGTAEREKGGAEEGAEPAEEDEPPLPELGLPEGTDLAATLATLRQRCGPPSLAETMDAAVAYAGLDPAAEDDLVDQARWAAVLPRVRLSFRRDWEHDESLDLQPDPDGGRFGIDTDDDVEIGVTAQWDLGALVAPPAATSARRLALEAERARRALRVEVAKAYFDRCLLRLEWEAVPAGDDRRLQIAWAIAGYDARLDALTGGFFRHASGEEAPEGRDVTWSNAGIGDSR